MCSPSPRVMLALLLSVLPLAPATHPSSPAILSDVPVMSAGELGVAAYRIPGLAFDSRRRVLMAFAEARETGCGDVDGRHSLALRRSLDGGLTWGDIRLVVNVTKQYTNVSAVWDPTAIFDETTGVMRIFFGLSNVLHSSLRRSILYLSSSDGGETWSEPVNVTKACMGTSLGDTSCGGHGTQLSSGRLLVPMYNLPGAGACYSDDGGQTWTLGQAYLPKDNPAEGEIAQLLGTDSETLLYDLRWDESTEACGKGVSHCRFFAYSRDEGKTWGNGTFVPELPDPGCKGSIISFRPRTGPSLLVSANAASTSARVNQTVFVSHDNGATWPHRVLVNAQLSGYSTLAQVQVHGNVDAVANLYEAGAGGCEFRLAVVDPTKAFDD